MKKRMKNKKGFTLIELIVVIAILGILAAIAIPRLGGFRKTADDAAIAAQAKILTNAAQMHAANTAGNTFPALPVTGVQGLLDDFHTAGYIDKADFTAADYTYDATTGIFTPATP